MKFAAIHFLLSCTVLCFSSRAQVKELKLDEAIALGLKNNFSILISSNEKTITKNNNTWGNAGFLPQIDANAKGSLSDLNLKSKDVSGEISRTDNNASNTLNLGLAMNWTLFDGFGMFIQKEKLSALQKLGETSMRATVENVLSKIIVSYFAIVQNKNRLKVLQNAINFSLQRNELTRNKFRIGSASQLAYLQSIVDLNTDSVAFLNQQAALKNAKADLNLLLVTDPADNFEVSDTIIFKEVINYDDLKKKLSEKNSQIEISKFNRQIAQMNYRLTHSPVYPQLDFFANYNLNRANYNYGQTRMNQNYGPVLGLNLSYNLYNGLNRQRTSANARIQIENSQYQLGETVKELETVIYQLYNEYQNNLKLINFEKENLIITQRNTSVAYQKYKLGELSDIDLRQIQLNELQAENSLLLAQFQAKQIETELLRLSGQLIQEP